MKTYVSIFIGAALLATCSCNNSTKKEDAPSTDFGSDADTTNGTDTESDTTITSDALEGTQTDPTECDPDTMDETDDTDQTDDADGTDSEINATDNPTDNIASD